MSANGALTVNVRTSSGKGAARTLRREGLIPAILYGAGKDNVSLSIDPRALQVATDPKKAFNTLFNLTIKEDGKSDIVEPCLLSEVQLDSIRRDVIHVDFMRVDVEKEVVRKVNVNVSGRAAGVVKGGKLKTFRRHVQVAAKPAEIPVVVEVDVTPLDSGESIRMKDIKIEGARLVENPEAQLAFVEIPKAKKEEAAEDDGKKKKK